MVVLELGDNNNSSLVMICINKQLQVNMVVSTLPGLVEM